MKRGTTDKKYAFKLGEKFVASLEQSLADKNTSSSLQQQQQHQQSVRRKRSQSADGMDTNEQGRNNAITTARSEPPLTKLGRKSRASSFDDTRRTLQSLVERKTTVPPTTTAAPNKTVSSMAGPTFSAVPHQPSALGDFAAQGTRRLMVRSVCWLSSVASKSERTSVPCATCLTHMWVSFLATCMSTHIALSDGFDFDVEHEFS
jgi:hypothetical protein